MRRMAGRLGGFLALVALLAPVPSAAQSRLLADPFPSPVFGGTGLFVNARAASSFERFRYGAELEVAWGASEARRGGALVGLQLSRRLLLTAGWTGSSASAWEERHGDRLLSIGLQGRGAGLLAARRSGSAAFDGFSTELGGTDLRTWIGLGTSLDLDLGLTVRAMDVLERGGGVWERRYTVAGYEFISPRRFEYLQAATHRDLEVDLSATMGRFQVSAAAGRGVSSGAAPDRSWGWARVATPLSRGLELLLEGGRTEGVPAIGRAPGGFARLGIRMDLTPGGWSWGRDAEPVVPAMPRPALTALATVDASAAGPVLIVAARGATSVEVKGDFTGWQPRPMKPLREGEWVVPLPPGVLRFNIRVDGAGWSVPAGVPVVPDEFSGAPVAVVVVG